MTVANHLGHDPYRKCLDRCRHDTAQAVLVSDLLTGDGPWDRYTPPYELPVWVRDFLEAFKP